MNTATITSSPKLRPLLTAAMLAGLIVAGTTAAISTAIAEPAPEPSIVVQYPASDLTTPQGIRALYLRIAAAAEQVCGGKPGMTDPIAVAWSRGCQKVVIERAVQAVGNPELATLHATHGEMLAYRVQAAR